jgi:hypothetical protein
MADDDKGNDSATEGDRAWRERMQETGKQAEDLQPPHDPETERGDPSPRTESS